MFKKMKVRNKKYLAFCLFNGSHIHNINSNMSDDNQRKEVANNFQIMGSVWHNKIKKLKYRVNVQ